MVWAITVFRLVSEPAEPGLFCGKEGLTLGGAPLLTLGVSGFAPRPIDELRRVFDAAYGADSGIDAESRLAGLQSVARALDAGDLCRATIVSLMLRLPEIDPAGMARLSRLARFAKGGYDSDEPRDRRGRWTNGSADNPPPDGRRNSARSNGRRPFSGFHGPLPLGNRRNPNISPVQLALPVPIGPPVVGPFGVPKPKEDDDYLFPPGTPQSGADQSANENARSDTHAANDNTARACPDPSFEPSSKDRKRRELLYQAQINKLPLGWGVMLNGIGYDGCRNNDEDNFEIMLEAKSGGAFLLDIPDKIKPALKEYKDTLSQGIRQNDNSGGRRVEWHFSDKEVSDYWRVEFSNHGLANIIVIWTPYDENYN